MLVEAPIWGVCTSNSLSYCPLAAYSERAPSTAPAATIPSARDPPYKNSCQYSPAQAIRTCVPRGCEVVLVARLHRLARPRGRTPGSLTSLRAANDLRSGLAIAL